MATEETVIHGSVSEGFQPVREAFLRNFADHGELGASVAVYVDGEAKVDLWGGVADPTTGRPWERDTIGTVYSATKGIVAVVCNLLAQRGVLDLDAPVCTYWPEFAANGKQDITVRQIMSHSAGLPVVETKLSQAQVLETTAVADALATQAPKWAPGTKHGYHGLTYGWLLGEIVRRVTGRSMGQHLGTEIAGPLSADFYLGLSASEESRVAPLVEAPPPDLSAVDNPELKEFLARLGEAMADPNSLYSLMASTNGALPAPSAEVWNGRDVHAAELGGAGGIGNGAGMARIYAACVSEVDGVRLLTDETVKDATRELVSGLDEVLFQQNRWGTGFVLPCLTLAGVSPASFGHAGAGGAVGFGDPVHRVGFGYVPNLSGGGERAANLTMALRECLLS
jgi:CubicO group peptidase (beta-lactamase class C family)